MNEVEQLRKENKELKELVEKIMEVFAEQQTEACYFKGTKNFDEVMKINKDLFCRIFKIDKKKVFGDEE